MTENGENLQTFTKYFCIYCKQFILKSQFNNHKIAHRNDVDVKYPETLEELKQRFSAIGVYDEI